MVPIRLPVELAPLGGVFDHLVTDRATTIDAVTFTSAPVAAVPERSRELDIEDQLLAALRTDVHVDVSALQLRGR